MDPRIALLPKLLIGVFIATLLGLIVLIRLKARGRPWVFLLAVGLLGLSSYVSNQERQQWWSAQLSGRYEDYRQIRGAYAPEARRLMETFPRRVIQSALLKELGTDANAHLIYRDVEDLRYNLLNLLTRLSPEQPVEKVGFAVKVQAFEGYGWTNDAYSPIAVSARDMVTSSLTDAATVEVVDDGSPPFQMLTVSFFARISRSTTEYLSEIDAAQRGTAELFPGGPRIRLGKTGVSGFNLRSEWLVYTPRATKPVLSCVREVPSPKAITVSGDNSDGAVRYELVREQSRHIGCVLVPWRDPALKVRSTAEK